MERELKNILNRIENKIDKIPTLTFEKIDEEEDKQIELRQQRWAREERRQKKRDNEWTHEDDMTLGM